MPFNFEALKLRQANGELAEECYESAIFRLEKEIEELRMGGKKVHDAAALLAEELDMGQLLSDKAAKPEPIYKLVELGGLRTDVIPLFPGDNVVGRGLGGIKAPTVSRKQLCITIDAANPERAFIKSMRDERAPSIPAIKRATGPAGGGAWKLLTNKGQSLRLGDHVCMQLKPGGVGKEPQPVSAYVLAPLDEAPPPEPSLGDRLKSYFGMG